MVWTLDNLSSVSLSLFIYKNLPGALFLVSEKMGPNIWPSAWHLAEVSVQEIEISLLLTSVYPARILKDSLCAIHPRECLS